MNFSPEQLKMASEMMGKMKPEEIQNMMRTFQQNPDMMEQARRMMGGQMPPGGNFGQPNSPYTPPAQHNQYTTPSSLEPIVAIKNLGNEFIKKSDYEKAGLKYLESILDIETLRTRLTAAQTSDQQFLSALNDLEISCRNNYCIAKSYLGEYNLLLPHCERVLLMDSKNQKALFNASQAHYNLKEFENARGTIDKLIALLGNAQIDDKITDLKRKIYDALKKKEEEAAIPKEPQTPERFGASQQVDDPELKAEPKTPIIPKEVKKETEKEQKDKKQTENKETVTESKKDDFEIEYDNESAQLEALFKRRQFEEQQRNSTGTSTEPESKPTTQPPTNEQASATPFTTAQEQPPVQSIAPHTSFLNRYWQVLLGILIGLLLSKLLRN